MKALILSVLILAAGNSMAAAPQVTELKKKHGSELADDQKSVDAFKKQITFHQRNIDLLYHQYELGVTRIKESPGNHAELDLEEAKMVRAYQRDIDNGVRVESGKKAIAEIAARYAEKHAQREAMESEEVSRLQGLLKTALEKEMKSLEASKKKYANVTNQQALSLLQEVEQYLVQLIKQIDEAAGKPSASLS